MSTYQDNPGSGASPHGQPPPEVPPSDQAPQQYAPPEYGAQHHGQPYGPAQYGRPAFDQPEPGQSSYAQPQYGQSQYDQSQYDQSRYGEPQYAPPAYGQPAYGQPAPFFAPGPPGYGQPAPVGYAAAAPGRPGGVITAAVVGFLFGAIGVIISFAAIFVGALATGASSSADESVPGLGGFLGAFGGAVIVAGILALVWTVVMIWGSVWALTGRSRVMLLVGGAVALAVTLLGLIGNLGSSTSTGGSVVTSIVFFLASLAIVILLSMKDAGRFFAAHRSMRAPR